MVGALDISLNEQSGDDQKPRWQPHFYALFRGCKRKELGKALRPYFRASESVPKPIHIERVGDTSEDRVNVLSYAFKTAFYRKVAYLDKKGKPQQKKLPLRKKHLKELLLFLDSISVSDRLFLHGVRRHGTKFLKI